MSPMASKLAYRPALKNTSWPSGRGAAGTVAEEEDEDARGDDEGGWLLALGGKGAPRSAGWLAPAIWLKKFVAPKLPCYPPLIGGLLAG